MSGVIPGVAGQRGVTLVEALVVLALLGLLALAGVELLPLLNRMSARSGSLQKGAAAMERVHDFTRVAVRNALPTVTLGKVGEEIAPLVVNADCLDLLTTLPPGLGGGGLYRTTITVDGTPGHRRLRLRVAGLRPDAPPAMEGTLVEDAVQIAWSYFDRPRNRWSDHWTRVDKLPDLVRLDVQMPGTGWWPPMIQGPMLGGGIFCEFDTVANACRRGGA
ncbi:prepilin-type N-terminal cleavage/methylation domain-containing protein [Nitrospirillum sp. BR 11752]|uniref:prepilin-type N-terminal cleavage/methylation domain-containing protein n=1 Tax=Nitrospirillum sp. BR 11752 TaxID=3104293 RepID=UPI002ECBE21D|nr:prepilin-type N-terminal cleavage/methylation domain-containing protein [Nitrospirillum sp. BR 11752]